MTRYGFRLSLTAMVFCSLLTSCYSESPATSKPIVKINDQTMTEAKFRSRIIATMQLYGNAPLTVDDKKRLLDQEIERELLIQEAVKRGLEKEPSFRDSIERFWEQTLITELLKRESSSLGAKILVTEEDIKSLYSRLCQDNTDCPPIDSMKDQLLKQATEEKKQMAIEAWLVDLHKKAIINVYEDNLKNMR